MAYTLKTTGIPAGVTVKACLIVNEAGNAVVDLVSGNSITVHADVTASIATGSWNGTARKYFTTSGSGAGTVKGVDWNATYPSIPWDNNTCSLYVAYESFDTVNGGDYRFIRWQNSGSNGLDLFSKIDGGSTPRFRLQRDAAAILTTTSDRITTKASIGLRQIGSGAGAFLQGSHGSALSSVYNGTDPGFLNVGPYNLRQFGGVDTAGWTSCSAYCFLMVQGTLSDADLGALHTDWFAELINGSMTYPSSDVSESATWTNSTGADSWALIDEATTPNDSDYIISPSLESTRDVVFGLSQTLAAGTYTIRIRGKYSTISGQLRAILLDNDGTTVRGTSAWQAVTGSYTTYAIPITTTGGDSTKIKIEVKA